MHPVSPRHSPWPNFASATRTLNPREQVETIREIPRGMEPAAPLPTLAVGRQGAPRSSRELSTCGCGQLAWTGTLPVTSLVKVDGRFGEMLILSLNWPGRQCPITLEFPGISSDGSQPGKMSRHNFPMVQGVLRQPWSLARALVPTPRNFRPRAARGSEPTVHV
jgi:hypothetical protein